MKTQVFFNGLLQRADGFKISYLGGKPKRVFFEMPVAPKVANIDVLIYNSKGAYVARYFVYDRLPDPGEGPMVYELDEDFDNR